MKKLVFLAAAALMMVTGCNQNKKTTQMAENEAVVEQTSGIYNINVKDIDGSEVSLANDCWKINAVG